MFAVRRSLFFYGVRVDGLDECMAVVGGQRKETAGWAKS